MSFGDFPLPRPFNLMYDSELNHVRLTSSIEQPSFKSKYNDFRLEPEDHEARHFSFDVLVGATGTTFSVDGFSRYNYII